MIDQLLTVTPDARTKIDGVRTFNDFPEAVLRVRVIAKEGPRFRYEIALEDPRERAEDDLAVEADGLTVVVDRASATDLAGATIELDPAVTGGGLRIENPNEGWQDPVARAVQEVLDRQINPGVGTHGGHGDPGGGEGRHRLHALRRWLPGLRGRGRDAEAGRRDGDSRRGAGDPGDRRRHRSRGRREPLLPARALAGRATGAGRRWPGQTAGRGASPSGGGGSRRRP